MDTQGQLTQALRDIEELKSAISALAEAFYKNNFSARQDFSKSSSFTTSLKIPHYASLPSTCEQGQIGESSGKLYICSAANTWTVAGTQS